MKKQYKFIIVATVTFILYAVFGFFWHNNIFPEVYYTNPAVLSIAEQNVIYMNFAMALLVYGLAYFMFKSIKDDTKLLNAMLWGIYYSISVIGFFNFYAIGIAKIWQWNVLILDMVWAAVSGAVAGIIIFLLHRWLVGKEVKEGV
jgi:uncharacterized membrane protein